MGSNSNESSAKSLVSHQVNLRSVIPEHFTRSITKCLLCFFFVLVSSYVRISNADSTKVSRKVSHSCTIPAFDLQRLFIFNSMDIE